MFTAGSPTTSQSRGVKAKHAVHGVKPFLTTGRLPHRDNGAKPGSCSKVKASHRIGGSRPMRASYSSRQKQTRNTRELDEELDDVDEESTEDTGMTYRKAQAERRVGNRQTQKNDDKKKAMLQPAVGRIAIPFLFVFYGKQMFVSTLSLFIDRGNAFEPLDDPARSRRCI